MSLYTERLGVVVVGPVTVPGIVQKIEIPSREINWQVQNGVAGLGAATIWRGVKLIESIKITTLLAVAGKAPVLWDEAEALWIEFMTAIHPNAATKPPAWDASHPLFRLLRPALGRVSHKSNGIAQANDRGTAWHGVLELIEYRPLKLAQAAPPDPAIIDNHDKPPADAQEQEGQDLIDKIKKL